MSFPPTDQSSNSLTRPLLFAALGLSLGLLIGFFIGSGKREVPNSKSSVEFKSRTSDAEDVISSSHAFSNLADNKILLGNITTVPFQELYGLLAKHSPSEIAEMAQQLNELPSGTGTNGKIAAFFKAWAHLDPRAAFKAASRLKTTEARDTAITATVSGADQSAAGWLASSLVALPEDALPTMNKAGLLAMVIQKWAEADAPAAAKFFEDNPQQGMSFTFTGRSIAHNWAFTDPAAAMAWANAHPAGPMGASPLAGAISGWWEKDHAAAEAFALSHLDDPNAMQFITAVLDQMVRDNPQRAVTWVDQLPNAEIRKQTETMMATMWAVHDSRAANQWAASLPEDRSMAALSATMSFWAQADPQAASQWLETLNGTVRDNAIGAFSSGLISKDPATAFKWVEAIDDETIRQRVLRQLASQWLALNPTAARSWIRNSSLSAAEKERLLAVKPGS